VLADSHNHTTVRIDTVAKGRTRTTITAIVDDLLEDNQEVCEDSLSVSPTIKFPLSGELGLYYILYMLCWNIGTNEIEVVYQTLPLTCVSR
jgi:hypothetical protein